MSNWSQLNSFHEVLKWLQNSQPRSRSFDESKYLISLQLQYFWKRETWGELVKAFECNRVVTSSGIYLLSILVSLKSCMCLLKYCISLLFETSIKGARVCFSQFIEPGPRSHHLILALWDEGGELSNYSLQKEKGKGKGKEKEKEKIR